MRQRGTLDPDKIKEIAEREWGSATPKTPIEHVAYSSSGIDRIVKKVQGNLTGQKTKEGKMRSLENLRPFLSKTERDRYYEEFGPYATALITDEERDYFRKRRDEILTSPEFDLDPIFDLSLVMMVVMDEIMLHRLMAKAALKPDNKSLQEQITLAQKRYRDNMRSLEATRVQRKEVQREQERMEDTANSLAELVYELHRRKQERLRSLSQYENEEEELLKKRALKEPIDYDDYDQYAEEDDVIEEQS